MQYHYTRPQWAKSRSAYVREWLSKTKTYFLSLSKIFVSNERRRYICNAFSHWIRRLCWDVSVNRPSWSIKHITTMGWLINTPDHGSISLSKDDLSMSLLSNSLYLILQHLSHREILHMPRQQCCHGLCKISMSSIHLNLSNHISILRRSKLRMAHVCSEMLRWCGTGEQSNKPG